MAGERQLGAPGSVGGSTKVHSDRFDPTENLRIASLSNPSSSRTTAMGLPVQGTASNTSTSRNLRFMSQIFPLLVHGIVCDRGRRKDAETGDDTDDRSCSPGVCSRRRAGSP